MVRLCELEGSGYSPGSSPWDDLKAVQAGCDEVRWWGWVLDVRRYSEGRFSHHWVYTLRSGSDTGSKARVKEPSLIVLERGLKD